MLRYFFIRNFLIPQLSLRYYLNACTCISFRTKALCTSNDKGTCFPSLFPVKKLLREKRKKSDKKKERNEGTWVKWAARGLWAFPVRLRLLFSFLVEDSRLGTRFRHSQYHLLTTRLTFQVESIRISFRVGLYGPIPE